MAGFEKNQKGWLNSQLRLIAGSDRLRRSDCEIEAPLGVIKLTIAIFKMAALSKVINNILDSFSYMKCSHKY